jgi:glycosyltransferase involved in cell wall biosynthesis
MTILCVGRLGEHKGQGWLLDAYGAARPSFAHPARLIFAGKDEGGAGGGAVLRRRIAAMRLDGEVSLAGEVDDEELERLYRSADLFALFSRYEAFGLVFCEAMAHGVPVLTHCVGANAQLLAAGAVLTEPFSRDEAVAALVRMVNDATARRKLGAEARALVETTYSWDAVAARYRRIYQEAVDERRRATNAAA